MAKTKVNKPQFFWVKNLVSCSKKNGAEFKKGFFSFQRFLPHSPPKTINFGEKKKKKGAFPAVILKKKF